MAVDSERKTVGVEISPKLHEMIVLASIYLDSTKSQVIRNALDKYLVTDGMSVSQYVKSLQQDLSSEWTKRKLQNQEIDQDFLFRKFLEAKKTEYKKVGLSDEIITKILNIKQ